MDDFEQQSIEPEITNDVLQKIRHHVAHTEGIPNELGKDVVAAIQSYETSQEHKAARDRAYRRLNAALLKIGLRISSFQE